jgi:hypothetical protein
MRGHGRYAALSALPGLIASGLMLAGCTTEHCGPSPKILATWLTLDTSRGRRETSAFS